MGDGRRTFFAIIISLVLVATAVLSLWLMASAGVFTADGAPLPGAPAVTPSDPQTVVTFPIGGRVQVSQPRDPFDPLVTPPPTTAGDSTVPGATDGTGGNSTTVPGETTSTAAGDATTTTIGDQPVGVRIALLEVREEEGVMASVVTVDGETFTVGVGEEFADDLKVVSLSASGGVFQLGDRVFSLAVGQSILK
jgi:hypothetical protein